MSVSLSKQSVTWNNYNIWDEKERILVSLVGKHSRNETPKCVCVTWTRQRAALTAPAPYPWINQEPQPVPCCQPAHMKKGFQVYWMETWPLYFETQASPALIMRQLGPTGYWHLCMDSIVCWLDVTLCIGNILRFPPSHVLPWKHHDSHRDLSKEK